MFTGRVLENLNHFRGEFSFGYDYTFVKRHTYHYKVAQLFSIDDDDEDDDDDDDDGDDDGSNGDDTHAVKGNAKSEDFENKLDRVTAINQSMDRVGGRQRKGFSKKTVICLDHFFTVKPRGDAQKYLDDYKNKFDQLKSKDVNKFLFEELTSVKKEMEME
jgi:hypothetical protein